MDWNRSEQRTDQTGLSGRSACLSQRVPDHQRGLFVKGVHFQPDLQAKGGGLPVLGNIVGPCLYRDGGQVAVHIIEIPEMRLDSWSSKSQLLSCWVYQLSSFWHHVQSSPDVQSRNVQYSTPGKGVILPQYCNLKEKFVVLLEFYLFLELQFLSSPDF